MGPTFLFARERRVAVFIGSSVKKPPLSTIQSPSLPLFLGGSYPCDYFVAQGDLGRTSSLS